MVQPTCMTIPAPTSRSRRMATLVMRPDLRTASGVLAGRVAIIDPMMYMLRLEDAAPRRTLRQYAAPSTARTMRTARRDAVPADLPAHPRGVRSAHGPA